MDIPPEVEMLTNNLYWARYYYKQYNKLFMTNQLRVDLLNEVAPAFF